MRFVGSAILGILLASAAIGQAMVQPIYDTQYAFEQAVAEKGVRKAFREFLADDAVIFRPEAVKAREYLEKIEETTGGTTRRKVSFADVSTNGLLGYTTGEWSFTPRNKAAGEPRLGQYATVWSRMLNGTYKAILDIEIEHDPITKKKKRERTPIPYVRDSNKRGLSVTDSTMQFLKLSMSKKGLGGAYDKFASQDVILLRDGLPPILGRGDAEEELERYMSIEFPARVSQFETADMAYSWNPCSYADSNEGMEKGNCLHVWKLRDKKWQIVLGVFARVINTTKPVLQETPRLRQRGN
jgi:ketosteroid isomerase-like protein